MCSERAGEGPLPTEQLKEKFLRFKFPQNLFKNKIEVLRREVARYETKSFYVNSIDRFQHILSIRFFELKILWKVVIRCKSASSHSHSMCAKGCQLWWQQRDYEVMYVSLLLLFGGSTPLLIPECHHYCVTLYYLRWSSRYDSASSLDYFQVRRLKEKKNVCLSLPTFFRQF